MVASQRQLLQSNARSLNINFVSSDDGDVENSVLQHAAALGICTGQDQYRRHDYGSGG